MKYRVIIAALAVCVPAVASATTWHVATTGNDSNAGSEASPFRTIQRAADSVAAGDTVFVHAGTYTGFLVTRSGTAAAPITFKGDGGTVAISGATTVDRDAIRVAGASFISIEQFTVTGATRAGISATDCDHITVRHNRVDANGRWGVFTSFCDDLLVEDNEISRSGTEHGVYASNSGDRPVVRRNTIWGNGMCGVHMNGDINFGGDGVISGAVVESNIIRDNGSRGGSGINGDGVTGALIRNNLLDGNHASGVSLYRIDGGAPSTGNRVVNNTTRMASDARWAINIQDGSRDNTLRNNILLHPNSGRGAILICSSCLTGTKSDHNAGTGRFMVDGTMLDLAGWRARTGTDAASFTANDAQLFASSTDLRLAESSMAVDRGAATDAPETDVAGIARPQGAAVDIGAYELPVAGGGDGSGGSDTDDDGGEGSGSDDGSGSGGGDDSGGDTEGGDRAGGLVPTEDDAGGCMAAGGHSAGASLALALVAFARRRRTRLTIS